MKKLSTLNSQLSTPKGFTLMELLIVIIIIGILASLIFANFAGVRQRGRDSQRKSDIKQIQTALELYRADNRSYPTSLPACGLSFIGTGSPPPVYMQKVPCDPQSSNYIYTPNITSITYSLIACLENTNDPQKDTTNNATVCTTTKWSFTVANP